MNLLGPLLNPAGVVRQVIGVAERSHAPLLAAALAELGVRHALILHGEIGMDEISPSGTTLVWEVQGRSTTTWQLEPARLGLVCDELEGLRGGEPGENATRIEELLQGNGDAAVRCAVLLNAAAALYVSGRGWSLEEAV